MVAVAEGAHVPPAAANGPEALVATSTAYPVVGASPVSFGADQETLTCRAPPLAPTEFGSLGATAPVPDIAMSVGLAASLLTTWTFADLAPRLLGLNWTVTAQVPSGATDVALHPSLVIAKCAGSDPVRVTALAANTRSSVPSFVITNWCVADTPSTATVPKALLDGGARCGAGSTPVPVRFTLGVEGASLTR